MSNMGETIEKYNWAGELIGKYELPLPMLDITSVDNGNEIIGLSEIDGEYLLYFFNI